MGFKPANWVKRGSHIYSKKKNLAGYHFKAKVNSWGKLKVVGVVKEIPK